MQYGNIASHTNGAGCIYTEYVCTKQTYIYTYRQYSVFTTSVGLAALAPITIKQGVLNKKKCRWYRNSILTLHVCLISQNLLFWHQWCPLQIYIEKLKVSIHANNSGMYKYWMVTLKSLVCILVMKHCTNTNLSSCFFMITYVASSFAL